MLLDCSKTTSSPIYTRVKPLRHQFTEMCLDCCATTNCIQAAYYACRVTRPEWIWVTSNRHINTPIPSLSLFFSLCPFSALSLSLFPLPPTLHCPPHLVPRFCPLAPSPGCSLKHVSVWATLILNQFELHWPSIKGTEMKLKVIKAIIIIPVAGWSLARVTPFCRFLCSFITSKAPKECIHIFLWREWI